MQSTDFVALLQVLAPLELAEPWDNVGVLIQREEREVTRVLLTVDLTSAVLAEALSARVDAIVSYHPPIFSGMKRIVQSDAKGNLVAQLLHAGILVHSPHTALDAVADGVNDWLIEALPVVEASAVVPLPGAPGARVGQGRIGDLTQPLSFEMCTARIKAHLGLTHLRVSRATKHSQEPIQRVAVCAGAGGALLGRCRADLLLTGEMRHHDVLEQRERGVSVILTEHTNSERGYLPVLKQRLLARAPELCVLVSQVDADPLVVV